MNQSSFDPMSMFEPYVPSRDAWLLFKVGSLDRMRDLQRGLLYMNSLDYFTKLEEEDSGDLRGDPTESTLARVYGGPAGDYIYKFTLHLPEGPGDVDVSANTTLTIEVPNPANVMVYCLSALADDGTGRIPGESEEGLRLDARFLKLGSHMVIIRDAASFGDRISAAIRAHPNLHNSKYFQGGYGRVEYFSLDGASGNIGLFRKDERYAWQREYRIVFGARDAALNAKGALELKVGDLSDITELVPVEPFVKRPIRITRRIVKKVDGQYVDVEPE